MKIRDFALMVAACLAWALNTIVSKLIVSDYGVAPMFYAAGRFTVVTLAVFPWLFPAPRPIWRIMLIGLLMGGGSFSLFFLGLKTSSPSAASIVGQLGLPVTTILSVLMLGEKIHLPRGLGIALSFIGVLIVMWNPEGMAASTGLLFIAAGAVASSFAAVMMKQVEGVRPLQFQAWVGLSSAVPIIILSALFEPGAASGAIRVGWPFVAAVLFSGLVVSVVAHTIYYGLIQRYEANLIAPLTLMVPLMTIVLGVIFTHDAFGLRMAVGTAVALSGVLIIAVRRSHVGAVMLWLKERF
jgi:drug/metabolite transporter (DMT)-like permease